MKSFIPIVSFLIITSALIAGCGEKTSNPAAENVSNQLTASDLAFLTDFHAWKVSIPQTEQPVKTIRLVIIDQRDGTAVTKFSTTHFLSSETCSSILLGIRVDQTNFIGKLYVRDTKGGGTGWKLDFADRFADSFPAWSVPGTLVWNGNRAQLAESTRSNNFDKVFAIELEK